MKSSHWWVDIFQYPAISVTGLFQTSFSKAEVLRSDYWMEKRPNKKKIDLIKLRSKWKCGMEDEKRKKPIKFWKHKCIHTFYCGNTDCNSRLLFKFFSDATVYIVYAICISWYSCRTTFHFISPSFIFFFCLFHIRFLLFLLNEMTSFVYSISVCAPSGKSMIWISDRFSVLTRVSFLQFALNTYFFSPCTKRKWKRIGKIDGFEFSHSLCMLSPEQKIWCVLSSSSGLSTCIMHFQHSTYSFFVVCLTMIHLSVQSRKSISLFSIHHPPSTIWYSTRIEYKEHFCPLPDIFFGSIILFLLISFHYT